MTTMLDSTASPLPVDPDADTLESTPWDAPTLPSGPTPELPPVLDPAESVPPLRAPKEVWDAALSEVMQRRAAAGRQPEVVPAAVSAYAEGVTLESLTKGTLPYRKGRLSGVFDIGVWAEGRMRVWFRSMVYCGHSLRGSILLADRASTEDVSESSVENEKGERMSWKAQEVFRAAAIEVARQWIATHPDCFEAADCLAARRAGDDAVKEVVKLKKELAAAEKRAADAMRDIAAREARLEKKGVVVD